MRGWVSARIWGPLRGLLRAGMTPKALAWSVVAGLAFGIIPLMGASTLLCVAAGSAFRLNQAAMQAANHAAYPLQLALLLPFIRLGERLFGAPPLPLSMPALQSALEAGAWEALSRFWTSLWHAGVAWLVVVPLPAALLAWALTPLFRSFTGAFRQTGAPPGPGKGQAPGAFCRPGGEMP